MDLNAIYYTAIRIALIPHTQHANTMPRRTGKGVSLKPLNPETGRDIKELVFQSSEVVVAAAAATILSRERIYKREVTLSVFRRTSGARARAQEWGQVWGRGPE